MMKKMSDDWSLKGKRMIIGGHEYEVDSEKDVIKFYNYKKHKKYYDEEISDNSFINISDIDTLREKLIQDYNQFVRNEYCFPEEMQEKDFIGIINKRFGIKINNK